MSDTTTTLTKLTAILSHVLMGEPGFQVTLETRLSEDLDVDSLDRTELVMAVEEEWGVDLPDEDADKLKTVGDLVKYIDEAVDAG
ncbi:acyl carrier protein [Verrucomicrobium sp. BvORR034]|uniref:acyl carrier protein n=1 Tax=Verrucomicrobium sp. BvORR034 TaxID=1396418 RepID=UPI0007C860EC|nr:acyl carrier protein [Verrucomicrobium sp. BvORR034]